MRSGSAASVEGGGNSHHAQAILSKGPSESTLTTTESAGGGNSSQTPSCRALAGSLASFDTSSIVNTEGMDRNFVKTCYFSILKDAYLPIMAIPVVEFSKEGYKIRKVFG